MFRSAPSGDGAGPQYAGGLLAAPGPRHPHLALAADLRPDDASGVLVDGVTGVRVAKCAARTRRGPGPAYRTARNLDATTVRASSDLCSGRRGLRDRRPVPRADHPRKGRLSGSPSDACHGRSWACAGRGRRRDTHVHRCAAAPAGSPVRRPRPRPVRGVHARAPRSLPAGSPSRPAPGSASRRGAAGPSPGTSAGPSPTCRPSRFGDGGPGSTRHWPTGAGAAANRRRRAGSGNRLRQPVRAEAVGEARGPAERPPRDLKGPGRGDHPGPAS